MSLVVKNIHELSALSTVSSSDEIVLYSVSSSTTGKSTLAIAIEDAGFVPINKTESTFSTEINNTATGLKISSEDYLSTSELEVQGSGISSTVSGSGSTANIIKLNTNGIQVNLGSGDIELTGTASSIFTPIITGSSVGELRVSSSTATLALFANQNQVGLYDSTNQKFILAKNVVTAGSTVGAATTFWGLATDLYL